MNRVARRAAAIAWPAFLAAAVLEIAVFAFVDPTSLQTLDGDALGWSATTVYSLAFFVFWCCIASACGLTVLLQRAADEINSRVWRDG